MKTRLSEIGQILEELEISNDGSFGITGIVKNKCRG